ncbi:nesprin-2a [Sphaeramia orbicularis]|uniref:nesprin-2a n=1 Tax=Sphaeramia orbicularis TaxID=375764 RepID=UPI00117BFBBC|nr:nesprin-1-like [Sphaeramia orbicularis]
MIIPETDTPPQDEHPSRQEVLESVTCLEGPCDLMESADDQISLMTENLSRIIRTPVNISSLTLADPTMISDLKDLDDRMQYEMRKLLDRISEEEKQKPEAASSLCQALHHLKQLRQQLEDTQSAAQALDHFLATVREVEAEFPNLLANQDSKRQQTEADQETEMQQRFQSVLEQSGGVDSALKAAGLVLTMDGTNVTCQDVVTLFRNARKRKDKGNVLVLQEKEQVQDYKEVNRMETEQVMTGDVLLQGQVQQHPSASRMEEESMSKTQKDQKDGESGKKAQSEGLHKAQTWKADGEAVKSRSRRRRRRTREVDKEGEEESLVQRRTALIESLRELQGAAEQLGLQEPTLPALQRRTRALMGLENRLAGHLSELQDIRETSQSENQDVVQGFCDSEVENVWDVTTKAITERLDQCRVLTELLKRFQSIRGDISGTLQSAENTISEQSSYMGKENLQRLHTKVQEVKAELNGLGDRIEEVRSVCRQLYTHLRQIPDCVFIPFEEEADALMDRWLDISERADSHLENLHLSLTRWDGVLQLGAEVESWTINKLSVFAQSPSFQTEEDIKALQDEIEAQEESMECFYRRTIEIQALLQSTEPPLELQVVEHQMKKKMEELKELVSEAVDVYRGMVAAKEHVTNRMTECFESLQKIQDSLLTLAAPDATTVLAKLKDLCLQLQTHDDQMESLQEDLHVMASIVSVDSLQSLSDGWNELQDKVRATHQLFSEVEEQTHRNIWTVDRLQREHEHLEQRLKAAEDPGVLKEVVLEERERTEAFSLLVSQLKSSVFQQSALIEESGKLLERYHSFEANILGNPVEKQKPLSKDTDAVQAQLCVGDVRQPDAPVSGKPSTQSPIEQRLQHVKEEATEGRTCMEEFIVTGKSMSQRPRDEDDSKQDFQDTLQKNEMQGRSFLRSVQPQCRDLQAAPERTSFNLTHRHEAHRRAEELQRQTAQLQTLFPWPGMAQRKQTCFVAHQLRDEAETLRLMITNLDEQRMEATEQTGDSTWTDSSVPELETCMSSLVEELNDVCSHLEEGVCNEEHFGQLLQDCSCKLTSLQEKMSACQTQRDEAALEALLQQVTDTENDLSQLATLKDSITSFTAEAHASVSQRVGNLQNHKRALDNNIREHLTVLQENRKQKVQQVEDEALCVQTALKNLSDEMDTLCWDGDVADIIKLKQQWWTIQDYGTRLTELDRRVYELQKTGESSTTDETLPADVAKNIDSLRSIFLLKQQDFSEIIANRVMQVISQLQQWRQTVQAEPPSSSSSSFSQTALDEGLRLQHTLREVISERGFLLNCVGTEVAKTLERRASNILSDNTSALKTLSKQRLAPGHDEIKLDCKDLPDRAISAPPDETTTVTITTLSSAIDYSKNLTSSQNDNKIKPQKPFCTSEKHPSCLQAVTDTSAGASRNADSPEQDQEAEISGICPAVSLMQTTKEDANVPNPDPNAEIRQKSKTQHGLLIKSRPKAGVFTAHICVAGSDAEPFMSDGSLTFNNSLITLQENTEPLQRDTTSTLEANISPDKSLSSEAKTDGVPIPAPQNVSGLVAITDPEEEENIYDQIDSLGSILPCKQSQGNLKLTPNEVLHSSKSSSPVAECQPTHATETTFLCVKQEETTESCHVEEQTMSPVLCTADVSLQTVDGDALTETLMSTSDNKQLMVADEAQDMDAGHVQMAKAENTQQTSDTECEEKELEHDTEVTLRQLQNSTDMEPERTAVGLAAQPGAQESTGGSYKHKFTMQDILSEIQSLVESSNIINRTPHTDLNWYLKSSPSEREIHLIRTVQNVLACRYQPAQLNITAMAKQLHEAEEHRRCVLEQVATMNKMSAADIHESDALKSFEGQCSAAVLDASATVQVKTAQLDQVKQYHMQLKILRAFLQVVAAEKEKMSLNSLGSSELQAEKLNVLLQTMEHKRIMMKELLHLSGQLSVHLSSTESSGALLAHLGDIQEEWRLLEGGIKRALQHASNSTCQSAVLTKEAKQLKARLETLLNSSVLSQPSSTANDFKSTLELVCMTTDLKLYNQLYLQLRSQSNALFHFSLGQKEKDEVKSNLQEVGSLLSVTKTKIETLSNDCGNVSSTKINKQLQDLITWAKQAENHISTGKKLALFPEEARIQIVEMKKFQTDILSRRSKMQQQVEEIKASDFDEEEHDQVLSTVEELYEAISDSLAHVLQTMKNNLQQREMLLCQLASIDTWLSEMHAKRDPCAHVENVSKADIRNLENELSLHKQATMEIERQLNLLETVAVSCKKIAVDLSPGESRYLVNRVSGLWTELDGLLAHEKATSWELEELIHERTSSDDELSAIQMSLKQISSDLERRRFPLTQEALREIGLLRHMLTEHQCQVQELQHCQEAKRSSVLDAIGELQDRSKALSIHAFEQDKYLRLRRQMEKSRDIAKEQIQRAKDKTISIGERFRLCQTLLVELPLVKTQCQEAADQLEAIAQDLYPSELNAERQRICCNVETLVSWEHSVTDDIKNLEAKLLLGLRFDSELPALIELFQKTKVELEEAKPLNPDEKAIDVRLQKYWVIWRNMESGMRVLEALARKEKKNLRNNKELYSIRNATVQECHLHMESLSQARESLKDYQWAAQGAIGFLHNAEATFLSAPGGFLDCTEEQMQTHQALEALEDGFQAHICHLVKLVPQQPCLSSPKTKQLHIQILSQLLVGRAVLEAQAHLRLESLQRCAISQKRHRSCHEEIQQHLSGFEAKLSGCAAEHVASFDKCVAQQERAKLLMQDLQRLAGNIEELRAGCPMQGCGVGKDGELGALWRRWVSLRRGVGLLLAHTEQRGEEWKDITTSMKQCCSFLASLQAEVPDCSAVSFTQEEPQELLAQAEMHQAGLEQEQQALASLEHRLEHALSLSRAQDPSSPGPVGKTLVKIKENVRSLEERNLLVVAAAQAEEKERQQVQDKLKELENHVSGLLPNLENCLNPGKQQELEKELSSQKAKLKHIIDSVQSRYAQIPADICRRLQEVQLSIQKVDEKIMQRNDQFRRLTGQVAELSSGLNRVKALLEQRSPTVTEAQKALKRVWDELDTWHGRLMLLENEVQDLAEDLPDQAHLLMDQLTQPLQCYQNAAQMVEHHTAFLSKIPACLQEFDDVLHRATGWLNEARSWLSASCLFTTARSLQNHTNSLKLLLDDSDRIRHTLQEFSPVLAEISAVCDISSQEKRLNDTDQQVHRMQQSIVQPLEHLLQAAAVVEAMEAEVRTMEKNVSKIKAILSSVDNDCISQAEHLHNRQVIQANMQLMRRTLKEMERCKGELDLPQGSEESLVVFIKIRPLLQQLEELEELCQQQAALLENNIAEGEGSMMSISNPPGDTQQETFEVSSSEEEEEDDECCHSSSSDTLTCSIPEDPEETLSTSDMERITEFELHPDVEVMSAQSCSEAGLVPVEPGLDTKESGCEKMEGGSDLIAMKTRLYSKADVGDTTSQSPQTAAAVEGTRLIPNRPVTPFAAATASFEITDEEDEHPLLSTASSQRLDTLDEWKEQTENKGSHSNLVEKSQQEQNSLEATVRYEDEDEEQQKWSQLYTQISQKLTTLKKVQEELQMMVPEREMVSTGSASAVLQQAHESISMLTQTVQVNSTDGSVIEKDLYEALRRVLLCLDALTDLLLTPVGAGEDDLQFRLLHHECVSAEMATLTDLLNKVEALENRPAFLRDGADASLCVACLQECLHTAQQGVGQSHSQLLTQLGLTDQQQEMSLNHLCVVDDIDLGQSDMFPSLKSAPDLKCVLGRHLRESPGEKAKLQEASQSLLRGITRLLELGEECITEGQTSKAHNRSQLQATLCRHKRLLQVLGSQLAFAQYLFQHEPEALKCQEDDWVQLGIRAKALQQKALEEEVASQRRLQVWTPWESNCGQLGRLLDECEAVINSGEPEGNDDEFKVQQRIEACQRTLTQLDESRPTLGLILDQGDALQTDSVTQTGGALELRWRSIYRRTEQEMNSCREIRDSWARFQTNSDSVSEWLDGANKQLQTWTDLADTSDLKQECVHSSLIKLLDFSMEVGSMSVQKASASREATQLLHLMEADCPGIRDQLGKLEVIWSQMTSDLSKTQEQLQQHLLAGWPLLELLSDLEHWIKKVETRLNKDKEATVTAKDAAQISEILQQYQELKAGIDNGQVLLDFLCQSGPQAVGVDVQAIRSERTMFAEQLGALRLRWLDLQGELKSQINGAEQMHHTCADRERKLQHLHNLTEQQKKKLNQWKQPISQTLARKALLEWEAVGSKVKEVAEAVQEVKAIRLQTGNEKEHTSDSYFSEQGQSVSHACQDLIQQMEGLKPVIQQTVEEWSCIQREMSEISSHITKQHCALVQLRAPVFSLKQAEGHLHHLQHLQVKAREGEELWVAVDERCQRLEKRLHRGTAQALIEEMERERKRWKDVEEEVKEEHMKAEEMVSLWQEYTNLHDSCSLHLQHLWPQWEKLLTPSPQQDMQIRLQSVEKFQDVAESVQTNVGNVLAASNPLISRLEPLARSLVQSQTRLLSRDVLLLSQAIAAKKKTLQEDFEQLKLFRSSLESLVNQTQDIEHKVTAGLTDQDCVEQVLSELGDLFPSLVDVSEMSASVSLSNQEAEKLYILRRRWMEIMTHTSSISRKIQAEYQLSQDFELKCKTLTSIQEKLERESTFQKPRGFSSVQEMFTVHQRLKAEIIIRHQLLHGLLCDAVKSMDKMTEEKKSEMLAQVASIKHSWFNTVAAVGQRRAEVKDQFGQWIRYRWGLNRLWKLLKDVDLLLPPAGPAMCPLQQMQSCMDHYEHVEEALGHHSSVYSQTLETGRNLCETMTEVETQHRVQTELQAIEEAWERTTSLLKKRKSLINTTVQTWAQCQDRICNTMSELDELKTELKPQNLEDEDNVMLIQETELSLQCLATGLKELATMKTDLSQYVGAGDSALLEQQLEQLHAQWEELCTKVSLRKQEIADRLNAWTIFNDKNKEFCDWLAQMENKVCHSADLSFEEMVEKLKKDCMEEINLFSENKSHLKQLGEQLLLASDEAKQSQVHGSLQEVNQRWHNLFHHIEARVKKLKETLVTVQQLDKNMSNLRSWLSRIEAELSRPITYSVCHHHEIQRRLAEQQELQRDIEQHTEGVASVLSLCDVLLRDEDAAGSTEAEGDSLQETSYSLDQRWRTICAMALDRRLRIEETWRLWCKFLDDYSRFEDWLKMAERSAANPNTANVLYTEAKEELKKFEGFQRQVHERLTQLELVNNQYRRLARENRTDRASQLKAMVHEGNRRWDTLHRRVAAILRRLKYFTSQREEFEGTRESMLVWLTELDLQLTNVEHFSESDVHHKIQQLNSFQKEITLNTERIDGLIVFGEGLIQKSSPQDAALIEDELEELHSYCQEVFSRLVRFHQRLSQPPITEEPEVSATSFSLESSLELIGRPWLGRSQGSLPATPTHLLTNPLSRSGRETPMSVDSLPLEWDHTGDVGGSSSHEDDDDEEHEDEGAYFSAVSSRSVCESPRWRSEAEAETDPEGHTETPPTLTSTPLKQGSYLHLMSQCSGSIESFKRVSLILDDEEQPQELGLTGAINTEKQSGVIERWELLQAQTRTNLQAGPQDPQQLTSDLDDITSWLENVIPGLEELRRSDPAASVEDMTATARELKEMQKMFTRYKSMMLAVNLRGQGVPDLQQRLSDVNRGWSRACTGLQQWDTSLRKTLMRCQEFHETLHSLLLWLAHAESRRYAVDINNPHTPVRALQQHHHTLTELQEELKLRRSQQASLQALWSQLQPEDGADIDEAQEKLHVTGSKLKLLLGQVAQDLRTMQQRLDCESVSNFQVQKVSAEDSKEAEHTKKGSSTQRELRDSSPPRSFFYRVLRAAFPLHLLLLLLLLLPVLIPLSEGDSSCTVANNFARSFYPMLHYTNGPPPT